MGTEEIKNDVDKSIWQSGLAYDQWIALPVSGPRPSARYKHAAAVVAEKLYITGGSRNGRYLSGLQVFDLRDLSWSNIKLKPNAIKSGESGLQEVLSPICSHSMIKWGSKLLLVGGHSKKFSDETIVWFVDLDTYLCGTVETSGKVPVARGAHSIALVGSSLIMFGGEDRKRRLLNDVNVLDLETMTWDVLETTQTPPAPRFDHTAAVHADRYLLVFGGCSHTNFYNDLHLLDLQSMEWSQPSIEGDLVTPRAGHAGITIGENWYIVGGGDNSNGCPETLVLNMSTLVWSVVTSVKHRDPLASEGLTVCSMFFEREKYLVAFGGYNGKYSNEVFFMRPKPRGASQPKIFQSPSAAAASVTAAYALSKAEKMDFSIAESNTKATENAIPTQEASTDIVAIQEEKTLLEVSLTEVRVENSSLRGKIEEINSTHAELSKELHSVQGQLLAERSRCFKLEAQIVELQNTLESMQFIEDEVQKLRRQKSEFERDIEHVSAVERQGSGGLWGWISGGSGQV